MNTDQEVPHPETLRGEDSAGISGEEAPTSTMTAGIGTKPVAFPTAILKLKTTSGEVRHVRAWLDTFSTDSWILEKTAKDLGLPLSEKQTMAIFSFRETKPKPVTIRKSSLDLPLVNGSMLKMDVSVHVHVFQSIFCILIENTDEPHYL